MDGLVLKRHADQLRKRYTEDSEPDTLPEDSDWDDDFTPLIPNVPPPPAPPPLPPPIRRSTRSRMTTDHGPYVKLSPFGHYKYLTDSEELELKNFIVKLAALGFGFGRKEVIALVQDLLDKRGVNKTITHGWWDGFRRRHPDIVLRQPEPISKIRYLAFNSEIIESYFKELECTLLDNDILEQPSLIFNMDETGFPLNPKSTFVACKRGEKHPSFITSGGKSHITVLACCSAS
uniref:HTH CENPB-type domain-containing protein n=1 Tax=Amphimedon queenslandica TaxID=400682 RepID=A0A1X7SM32_AMPQE